MRDSVIGLGEVLWDMLPEGKRLGGAPANFAYHTSQLGLGGTVVSAVGDDELGNEIKQELDKRHLAHHLETVGYPTGTVGVTVDAAGIPVYDITTGVAWDNIHYTDTLAALAHDARAVCFGSLAQRSECSRTTIGRFIDAMPADEGTLRIFDINLRQDFYDEGVIAASIRRCNILKLNEDEVTTVKAMFPAIACTDDLQFCRRLLGHCHLKALILTRGGRDSAVLTHDTASVLPTPRVKLADTVGAGDSFTAAFTSALLTGATVTEAHRLAIDVSAFVCTCHGAMPVLPDELKSRLK